MTQLPAATGNLRDCVALRADGEPCRAAALPGAGHCWAHSEATAALRADARRRGGQNRSNANRARVALPPRLVPLVAKLEVAFDAAVAGALDPKAALAAAALARALVIVVQAGELELRLRRLEELAAEGDEQL